MSGKISTMGRGTNKYANRQSGFVSIIVTIIIIVFVTLVAVSFAFLSRQNQTQSLNSRLSTQAFYAAESGVNQAIRYLKTPNGVGDYTNCNSPITSDAKATLDADGPVKYTCVLINNKPVDLRYDAISTTGSTIVHIKTAVPVDKLEISWQDTGANKSTDTNDPSFAASSSNFYLPQKDFIGSTAAAKADPAYVRQTAEFPKHTGILRATIIPSPGPGSSYANLTSAAQNIFLYPRATAGSNGLGNVNAKNAGGFDGVFGDGKCSVTSAPNYCNVKITGIGSNDFYVRLKAIYKNVSVTMRAFDAATPLVNSNDPNGMQLLGTQAVIDSTGRAVDTVRRIQVRVPLQEGFTLPEFALESADTICKIFAFAPGTASYVKASGADTLYHGTDPNNAAPDNAACTLPGMGSPSVENP